MSEVASQITSLTIVYSNVYSVADQRKHQSYASLAFVRGIHRKPVNSPHKGPVTRKMFPFDDVIMSIYNIQYISNPITEYFNLWDRHSIQYPNDNISMVRWYIRNLFVNFNKQTF